MQIIKKFDSVRLHLTNWFLTTDKKQFKFAQKIALALFVALLIFNVVSSWISSMLVGWNNSLLASLKQGDIEIRLLPANAFDPSYEKNIMDRNIFNLSGKIPFEDMENDNEEDILKNFDNVPCSKSEKSPVELIGIIYTEDPKTNLVTVKDSQASHADVYHEGDAIIDHDNYSIYKIPNPYSVQMRKKRIKICLTLPSPNESLAQEGLNPAEQSSSYTLSLDYVKNELGAGFSKIITSARLVPEISNDKMQGFKIFSIAPGSLFESIQLENGDVIKDINGVNLQDPQQGFKIYEAFQDENIITLQILRNGVVITKKVTVQ